jgi:uncharacterized membrane protein
MSFKNYSHLWTSPAKLDVRLCFKVGFEIFLKSPGITVGFFIIAVLVGLASLLFASIIPLLGNIAATTVHFSLAGGFFIAAYKLYRGKEINLSDCFSGFNQIGQLVLMALIVYGFFMLILIPLGIGTFLVMDGGGSNNSSTEYFYIFYIGLMLFALVVGFAASVAYLFALPNIMHLGLKAWGAMELSRRVIFKSFGRILLLVFLIYLINIAGIIVFGLGLLVSIPVSFFVTQVAWEQMVGIQAVPHFEQLIDELGNDSSTELFADS